MVQILGSEGAMVGKNTHIRLRFRVVFREHARQNNIINEIVYQATLFVKHKS